MKGKVIIKIESRLDTKWVEWFDGFDISYEGSNTTLTGTVADDSALHGILIRIRNLNLKLISVNPIGKN